jgi:hypothetical protein
VKKKDICLVVLFLYVGQSRVPSIVRKKQGYENKMRPKIEYDGIVDDASVVYIMNSYSSSSSPQWPQLGGSDNKQIKRTFAFYSLTVAGVIVDFFVTVAIIICCHHRYLHHQLLLINDRY